MSKSIASFGVVGFGVVGQATAYALSPHIEFRGYYDIRHCDKPGRRESVLELVAAKPDCIFVCVWAPTDMETGRQDLHAVTSAVEEIREAGHRGVVVIRSTINPHIAGLLDDDEGGMLCVSPEFLTEANALEDAANPQFNIVGGKNRAAGNLRKLYRRIWPNVPVAWLTARDAMTAKYMINCYLAVKVALFNEFYQQLGHHDWEAVRKTVLLDERIGASHTQVPGPDGDLGFGGKCFPKDLRHLMTHSSDDGILAAAFRLNQRVRKNRDWEAIQGATV